MATVIWPNMVRIFWLMFIITSYTDEAEIILILNLANCFTDLARTISPPPLQPDETLSPGMHLKMQKWKVNPNQEQYFWITTNTAARYLIDQVTPLFSPQSSRSLGWLLDWNNVCIYKKLINYKRYQSGNNFLGSFFFLDTIKKTIFLINLIIFFKYPQFW